VLLHQSIIGLREQSCHDLIGEYPDVVIGCAGRRPNLAA
jgi:tryptophan synthase beta chain